MRLINNKVLFVLLLFTQLASVTGCEKNTAPDEYKLKSIFVDKTELSMQAGDEVQLKASAVPSVANQPAFQWSSSDEKVATVNGGLVKAKSAGTAVISVQNNDVKTDVNVNVINPEQGSQAILFNRKLDSQNHCEDLVLDGAGDYTKDGLLISKTGKIVKLNKFYALAERMARYEITPSSDAKAVFQSSQGDFKAYLDVPGKRLSIATTPVSEVDVPFLEGDKKYIVEIYHIYQTATVRITDKASGKSVELSVTNDGQGGCGKGSLQQGFYVGPQWDHYCFGLESGSSMLVKRISVFALKKNVKLLIYGDSISQPEAYFPTKDFPDAWTQRIIAKLNGEAMSSGRGSGNITMLLEYIKNELPFVKAKYVMVTIGANGGNTEENLSELVQYIKSCGSIPILNNTSCNESGTQVDINKTIMNVREKFGIKGCRFDFATSLEGDGLNVDKSLMFWEDYTGSYGWQIYHHPNGLGGKKMFDRTLTDVPEIYL